MKYLPLYLMLALFVFVGCGEPEPEPPPPAASIEAPKKSADQLHQETMKKMNPAVNPTNPRALVVQAICTDVKGKYRPPMEPNGPEALTKIKRDLNTRFDRAYKAGQWKLVITIAGGLDVFAKGPPERTGELKKIDRLRKRAMAELSKPKLRVTGFLDDYVMLEITIPTTNKKTKEQVREGDRFLDDPQEPGTKVLRLDEIIGDNRGVRIYYYKTDTSWIVPGPRG